MKSSLSVCSFFNLPNDSLETTWDFSSYQKRTLTDNEEDKEEKIKMDEKEVEKKSRKRTRKGIPWRETMRITESMK